MFVRTFVSADAWTRTRAAVSSHFHSSGDRHGASERESRCFAPAAVSVVLVATSCFGSLQHFVVASGGFTPGFVANTPRSDWLPEQEAERAQQPVNWKKMKFPWQIMMGTFSQLTTGFVMSHSTRLLFTSQRSSCGHVQL